jgi:hypothetical protein
MEFRHLFVRCCVFRDCLAAPEVCRWSYDLFGFPAVFCPSLLSRPRAPFASLASPTVLLTALSTFQSTASVQMLGHPVPTVVSVPSLRVVFKMLHPLTNARHDFTLTFWSIRLR